MNKNWKDILAKIQQKNEEKERVTEKSFSIGTILYMALDECDGIVLKGYDDRNIE